MFKQLTLATLLATVMPFFAMGQFTIKGQIVDKTTKQSLPAAHIRVNETFKTAISDLNGVFELSNLKAGTYQIEVSYLGYESFSREVKLEKDLKLTIGMESSAIMVDEVIVSATRADDHSATTYENVVKADIKKANVGQDLPYILDQTPSVVSSSDAGAGVGYTGIRIRGSDITRINVTVNGIPLNDAESHGVFFVNMPDFASSLNSIQVQRGVGTSTNGAAAFGASINMETATLNTEPFAEISTAFGSFNTQKYTLNSSTGLIDGKWVIDTRLSKISSDGFIDRASSDLKSFYTSFAYHGKKSLLKVIVFSGVEHTYQAWNYVPSARINDDEEGMQVYLDDWHYSQEEYDHMLNSDSRTYNYYTYDNETDNYQQDHFQLHYSKELSRLWNMNAALHYTRGKGYYESYKADKAYADYGLEDQVVGDDTVSSADFIQQKWLDNHFYGTTFSFKYDPKKNMVLTLGGALNQYDGDHYGDVVWASVSTFGSDYRWYTNNGLKSEYNLYAKLNYFFSSDFSAYADLQHRYVDYKMEGIHDDLVTNLDGHYTYSFINPKLGFLYNLNAHNKFYGSLAMANREPSRSDFRDADEGQKPVPENLTDFELGYSFNSTRYLVKANAYFMDYNDQLVLTGEINNVGAPIMVNVDNSYRVGLELLFGAKMNNWFAWNFNVAFSQNKIQDFVDYTDDWNTGGQVVTDLGTTDISFSPGIVASNVFVFTPLKGLDISLISKYVGDQYVDNTSNKDRMIDAYFVNNLRFDYNITVKGLKNFGVFLQLNNIFSEEYETNAWVYKYRYNGMDRAIDGYATQAVFNFMLGLDMKF